MPPAIHVENLSKKYRLGATHSRSLGELVESVAARMFRRQNGHAPSRIPVNSPGRVNSENDFWALRDVTFEVEPGEVVGIVGRNGAGKSTLLKILSRITSPTGGRAQVNGRVASLLEVGTGFHPELTGRENIYLNGAILGMTKSETRRRFDEIVDFSEISEFIETPVKRYSSGMYVRLAFAVAAHLDPEILIVDEVLAVGDAQFQAKCLRKLQDASRHAQTVLFVSHNLHAISSLCSRAILLNDGRVKAAGETSAVVSQYLSDLTSVGDGQKTSATDLNGPLAFTGRMFIDHHGRKTSSIAFHEPILIELTYRIAEPVGDYRLGITLETSTGIVISTCTTEELPDFRLPLSLGEHRVLVRLPEALLGPGSYFISCCIDRPGYRVFDNRPRWDEFTVVGNPLPRNRAWEGIISLPAQWQVQESLQ
jgi:lipopolysaccharide transport system ATP-binding protein